MPKHQTVYIHQHFKKLILQLEAEQPKDVSALNRQYEVCLKKLRTALDYYERNLLVTDEDE